jgi:hypothetical protein
MARFCDDGDEPLGELCLCLTRQNTIYAPSYNRTRDPSVRGVNDHLRLRGYGIGILNYVINYFLLTFQSLKVQEDEEIKRQNVANQDTQ